MLFVSQFLLSTKKDWVFSLQIESGSKPAGRKADSSRPAPPVVTNGSVVSLSLPQSVMMKQGKRAEVGEEGREEVTADFALFFDIPPASANSAGSRIPVASAQNERR